MADIVILLSQTYQTFTDESLEDGEAEEQGFVFENSEHSFEEVVRAIKGLNSSQTPITNAANVFFTEEGEPDFEDGSFTNKSLHFCRGQSAEAGKAWEQAIREAGFDVRG